MKGLIRQILELAMSCEDSSEVVVLAPSTEPPANAHDQSGSFAIPDDLFPPRWQIRRIAPGEAYVEALKVELVADRPMHLFLVPPLIGRRNLSDKFRAEFPLMDLGDAAITHTAGLVAPGSIVGALLPTSFFYIESSRSAREYLEQVANPTLIVEHNHPSDVFGINAHVLFRMGAIYLKKGDNAGEPIRFFKCLPVEDEAQCTKMVADFRSLLKRGGGETQNGYVIREQLPPGLPWTYDAQHPELTRKKAALAEIGKLKKLGDLVDARRGLNLVAEKHLLIDASDARGVAVVEGRDINIDGTIESEEPRFRALVPEDRQLRQGDICVRTISRDRLVCAVVSAEMEPATAGHSVIVLRPHPEVTSQDRELLVAYLRSSACSKLLNVSHLGDHMRVLLRDLLELPVPVADDALRLAVESLGNAAKQFKAWAEELEAARGSLFDSDSVQKARTHALSMGRLAKQRYEAAILVSDFKQRVRTRFPYPIAFRWRTVESQHPTLEGYIQVLECAEVAVTYLAILALVLAESVGKPIQWRDEMAKRISTTGHGTNMGDWISILQEANGKTFAKAVPDAAPFVEVSRILSEDVKASLRVLSDFRNSQAHGRGPKGSDVISAFEGAKKELETLLRASEFLTDFPLLYIETTRRDTLQKRTRYEFRELMGDHALVPLSRAETPDAEIEAQSLYLIDRSGHLHLLRGLLVGRECPICHSWATFFLDACAKGGVSVTLKSMEHGHTWNDQALVPAFRHRGMIQ